MEHLTPDHLAMYIMLKAHPGMLHVTSDGNHIYAILGEGETEGLMDIKRIGGPLYTTLNEDEINEVLVDHMQALIDSQE